VKLQNRISAINLPQLRCAVVAAEEGSFRRAAEVLLVRQSTLSRGIRQLEHLIGISIFDRSSGGVTATASGRSFLRHARSILEQIDSLITTADRTSRGEAGRISIGFYTSFSAGTLRTTLQDFRQRFPDVKLDMVEKPRTGLMSALRSGALDAAIVTGDPVRGDSGSLPIWSERILLALPEGHPLGGRETIYWTDLVGETILLSQCGQGRELEELLISKLWSSEDRPRIERHEVNRSIIKSLVGVVAGVTLVLESDIGAKISGLVYREIRDGNGPSRIGYSAYWREDNENPARANFLNLLRERYPSPVA
jgi:DNA-binding transcriptional LysR family regulator